MRDAGQAVAMPPLDAKYLADWWLEIGPAGAGGESPIGWSDLAAWQGLTGIELDPWEARTLRRMSQSYLAEGARARQPGCPPPWQAREADEDVNDRVTRQFAEMMAALSARDKAAP
jgi:hypothetical protein